MSKSDKIGLSKSTFYVKNHRNHFVSTFFWFWHCLIFWYFLKWCPIFDIPHYTNSQNLIISFWYVDFLAKFFLTLYLYGIYLFITCIVITKVPINFDENLEKDDTIWTRYIGSEYVFLILSRSLILSSHEKNWHTKKFWIILKNFNFCMIIHFAKLKSANLTLPVKVYNQKWYFVTKIVLTYCEKKMF